MSRYTRSYKEKTKEINLKQLDAILSLLEKIDINDIILWCQGFSQLQTLSSCWWCILSRRKLGVGDSGPRNVHLL